MVNTPSRPVPCFAPIACDPEQEKWLHKIMDGLYGKYKPGKMDVVSNNITNSGILLLERIRQLKANASYSANDNLLVKVHKMLERTYLQTRVAMMTHQAVQQQSALG